MEVFFKYEKLNNHCYICGFMDHVAKNCDKEESAEGETPLYAGLRADDYDGGSLNYQGGSSRPPQGDREDAERTRYKCYEAEDEKSVNDEFGRPMGMTRVMNLRILLMMRLIWKKNFPLVRK